MSENERWSKREKERESKRASERERERASERERDQIKNCAYLLLAQNTEICTN